MSRGFSQRRRDREARIRDHAQFLQGKIDAGASRNVDRDKAAVSSLLWALEEIERLDYIEQALAAPELRTDLMKLAAISAIVNSRHEPTDADIQRTVQLNRAYGWEKSESPS